METAGSGSGFSGTETETLSLFFDQGGETRGAGVHRTSEISNGSPVVLRTADRWLFTIFSERGRHQRGRRRPVLRKRTSHDTRLSRSGGVPVPSGVPDFGEDPPDTGLLDERIGTPGEDARVAGTVSSPDVMGLLSRLRISARLMEGFSGFTTS